VSLQTLVETPTRPGRCAGWDRLRWALVVVWVALVATGLAVGQRSSSLRDLEGAIASGEVRTVSVAGGMPRGATGFATQEVIWRAGLLRYRVDVLQVPRGGRPADAANPDAPLVRGDIGAVLSAEHPDLHVVRTRPTPLGADALGWHLPSWLGFVGLLGALAGLVLLVSGPQPWRATRWGWFWLIGNPLGALAFLLLSGPTPPLPAPRDRARRLTGGWAFLLALALGLLVDR
jgi:hypothetical protein